MATGAGMGQNGGRMNGGAARRRMARHAQRTLLCKSIGASARRAAAPRSKHPAACLNNLHCGFT